MKVEFTQDFERIKKGDILDFSKDISNIFINNLKVAKIHKEEDKPIKVKPKKNK